MSCTSALTAEHEKQDVLAYRGATVTPVAATVLGLQARPLRPGLHRESGKCAVPDRHAAMRAEGPRPLCFARPALAQRAHARAAFVTRPASATVSSTRDSGRASTCVRLEHAWGAHGTGCGLGRRSAHKRHREVIRPPCIAARRKGGAAEAFDVLARGYAKDGVCVCAS